MFQWKNEKFNDLCNEFGIADDILIVGYAIDGKNYDKSSS